MGNSKNSSISLPESDSKLTKEDLSHVISCGTGNLSFQNEELSALRSHFGSELEGKRLDARRMFGNCFSGNSLDVIAAALLSSDRDSNVLALSRNEEGQNVAIVIGSFTA